MEIPSLNGGDTISTCKLSNNNLFCVLCDNADHHSFKYSYYNYYSIFFLIYPDCSIRYLPNRSISCKNACPILYNNEVYFFGGEYDKGLVLTAEKFSLIENKWKPLSKLSCGARYCNGFAYKDEIFFVGAEHKNIYIYSVLLNTYKEVPANLSTSLKILFFKNSSFYLIESSSNVFEININDPSKLKCIGKCWHIDHSISQIVQFRDSIYFIGSGSSLYKFDLALGSAQLLKPL